MSPIVWSRYICVAVLTAQLKTQRLPWADGAPSTCIGGHSSGPPTITTAGLGALQWSGWHCLEYPELHGTPVTDANFP